MLTLTEYSQLIEHTISTLQLPAQPAGLYEPIRYALLAGGKRLRPVLTLATTDAFGLDHNRALNQAIAVEMFHNFTLLHDDLMDHADLRRGRPTVHRRYDERTAILSGDAMLTLAGIYVGADNAPAAATAMLNKTAMEVYEGQQLDMDFETTDHVPLEQYLEMIRLKTSVLLGCACSLGAIMAGADSDPIYDFGVNLGLAFQLQDDYLDTFGDTTTFGKAIGGDILNNKQTWLRIMALESDTEGIIRQETTHPSDNKTKIARITALYEKLGLPQTGRQMIADYTARAINALNECRFSSPGSYTFFADLAHSINGRTR